MCSFDVHSKDHRKVRTPCKRRMDFKGLDLSIGTLVWAFKKMQTHFVQSEKQKQDQEEEEDGHRSQWLAVLSRAGAWSTPAGPCGTGCMMKKDPVT